MVVSGLIIPVVGRMADLFGVRRTVTPAIFALPVSYVAFSMMTGSIVQYAGILFVQIVLCVSMTSTVYSRIAVQYSSAARGISLAIVASGPALTGAILAPVLNGFVEANGWRAAYHLLAAMSLASGIATLLLLPKDRRPDVAAVAPKRRARDDYPLIVRNPAFWVVITAMLLCNLPNMLGLSQMKLLLLDNGVSAQGTSVMLSAFAIGVLLGRFIAGFALDRFPTYLVGMIGMGMPSIGLLLIASSMDAPAALTFAVLLIGLSFGAEGDIIAYIVAQHFGLRIFSSVFSLGTLAVTVSTSTGSLILSLTLKLTDSFNLFLVISSASVLLGSMSFLFLARRKPDPAVVEAAYN